MQERQTTPQILTRQGFTIIEVIAALLIIGILTAVVASRIIDNSAEVVAESEIIKAHLRFVQSRAMNSDVSWGIRFDGSSYTMLTNNLTSNGLLPNESTATHTLAKGNASASTNPVIFDQWGSPGLTNITVTVTDGSSSRNFIITKNTGFIP